MRILTLPPAFNAAKCIDGNVVLRPCSESHNTHNPCCRFGLNELSTIVNDEELFYYKIDVWRSCNDEKPVVEEHGVGKISDGQLIREHLIGWIDGDSSVSQSGEDFYDFGQHDYIGVHTYRPDFSYERRVMPNSVVFNDGVISLNPGQFVFCDETGMIRAGDTKDLIQMLNLQGAIGVDQGIHFKPTSSPTKPKAGTVIFNKNSGKLEFYDGFVWLEIGME
jgi:hypothetical protein